MLNEVLDIVLSAIFSIGDMFQFMLVETGLFGLVIAAFILFSLYRFIFAPLFGNLRAGSSDQVRKKKDDE